MCGIAGFLSARGNDAAYTSERQLSAMTARLAHRGPDDMGLWTAAAPTVALGHRRLSILDLSPEGHQPMTSRSGRYVLTFNGEIYNFRELRHELEDCAVFRGSSDTEVMLAAFERWGVSAALPRFNGMFAFAAWDKKERVLTLGRDRAGEKPLYYAWTGSCFLFASELKALRAHPEFEGGIDRGALALFLRHGYVPGPYSIYSGVSKLPPGSTLSVTSPTVSCEPVPYWSLKECVESGSAAGARRFSDRAAEDELDELLSDSVRLRMISDVPLGAFLSGGIDSSAIVALMQKHSGAAVKTFSIGFYERDYNEAAHAAAVARHLGTDHTELYVTPSAAAAVIPRLPEMYDEPFADSSQIPTFLVSELARRHVTVSLSGDAADELFGGYTRYQWAERLWRKFDLFPGPARRLASRTLRAVSPKFWNGALGSLPISRPAEKVDKLAGILGVKSPEELYLRLVSSFSNPAEIVAGGYEPRTILREESRWPAGQSFLSRMMFLDTMMYLPDDILVKIDRASMAVGLEARVPFLDPRVIEFAWRLPARARVRGGQTKWLLRQVLKRYVPPALTDRPKCGFGVPVHQWLRGPLRDWAESLLAGDRLRREGFFEPEPIREKWREHLSEKQNWAPHLWAILMFQSWLDTQAKPVTGQAEGISNLTHA